MDHTAVKSIQPFDGGVTVDTDNGTFECKRLIITAGAWADKILADVGINLGLTVTQEQVMYYATPNLKKFSIGQFPVFLATGSEGMFYGFPVYGLVATKATVGSTGIVTTADGRSFEPDAEVERDVEEWLNKYIPGFTGPKILSKTCLYARPRDVNFVIDTVPGHPQIIVCNGAGHGYKFSSLLGKILSEMAIDGETEYPIAPFTLQREAITDPNYVRPPFGRESQFTDGAQRTARYGG
jgi:sarcosine oxidase